MKKSDNYKTAKNIILILDGIIALLIIITAKTIAPTQLGKSALIFGLIMLLIVTALKIKQEI